jgi:hypothetical protein
MCSAHWYLGIIDKPHTLLKDEEGDNSKEETG